MKITPKVAPTINKPSNATPNAQASRDRAIALLAGSQAPAGAPATDRPAPQTPVNGNAVSIEDVAALKASSEPQPEAITEESRQTTTTEPSESQDAPKVEETKDAPKEEPLSTQYALLARKEKALRAKVQAQEQALKVKEAEIQAREDALKAKDAEYSSKYVPKDSLTQDPLTVLSELGLTYDQITEMQLNRPQQDPVAKAAIQKLTAEIEALKNNQKQSEENFKKQQDQSYQQAINQIKSETKALVSKDPAFETIHSTNSVDDVVDLIERTFKEEGRLLTVEEAAQAVEDHLVEEAIKITKIKKIQQKLNPPAAPAAPKTPEAQPKQSQTIKTLTNAVGVSRQLSTRERAILAFKGENK